MMQKIFYLLILVSGLFVITNITHAFPGQTCGTHADCQISASNNNPACGEICDNGKCMMGANPACYQNLPGNVITIQAWIDVIADWFAKIAGAIAVGGIVFAGMYYATAGGSQKRIENAKKILLYSILGGVIIMMAWGIVHFIMSVLSSGPPPAPEL